MRFLSLISALAAVTGLAAAAAHPALLETRETCSTPDGSGTCKSTSSCSTFSVPGYCSGGVSNQCCVSKTCSTSKGSGTCKNTGNGCSGGAFVAGACPGSSSIQCCVPQSSSTCSTPSGSGKCQSTSSCKGFSLAGYCPGPSDNQCCLASKSCSTSKGTGTCKNTSLGCSGGSFVSGACPGSASVQCCVAGTTTPPSGGGALPGLDATQSAHAHAIMDETKKENLGRQGCLAAITTGYTEASLLVYANSNVAASLNYPHDAVGSDHDSVGIFQQRVSIYTNIAADMDPAQSAAQFFANMVKISGWQTMDVGTLCQTVQGSAYPDRYNEIGLPIAGPVCDAGGF